MLCDHGLRFELLRGSQESCTWCMLASAEELSRGRKEAALRGRFQASYLRCVVCSVVGLRELLSADVYERREAQSSVAYLVSIAVPTLGIVAFDTASGFGGCVRWWTLMYNCGQANAGGGRMWSNNPNNPLRSSVGKPRLLPNPLEGPDFAAAIFQHYNLLRDFSNS